MTFHSLLFFVFYLGTFNNRCWGTPRGRMRSRQVGNNNAFHISPTACGVFEEWRPDLMGTCRPDYAANVQERDITVTTPYGRIRGFYVHLFDGPGVQPADRPGVYNQGKLWRTVSTFLGIPYATPPINEGRFKVISFSCKLFAIHCFNVEIM